MSLTEFNEAEFIANRKAEGMTEAFEKVAVRMIQKGISDDEIADTTGCALERIAELRNGMMAMV